MAETGEKGPAEPAGAGDEVAPAPDLRERVRLIIFEADTPLGKLFDVVLIVCIVTSVLAVMLSTVEDIQARHGPLLVALEWVFTLLFTVEYGVRLWSVKEPWRYARSFYGIVDLVAIIPTYLSLFFSGAEFLIVVRSLRALRVFRVLKLLEYVDGGNMIMRALRASRAKITVFLLAVVIMVTIVGSTMYLVEGAASGYTSIPKSVYWAIVTLTTVGYGDIHPVTPFGQVLASLVMLMGYAVIAVPTGIVTAEMTLAERQVRRTNTRSCKHCTAEGHADDAVFCRRCGNEL